MEQPLLELPTGPDFTESFALLARQGYAAQRTRRSPVVVSADKCQQEGNSPNSSCYNSDGTTTFTPLSRIQRQRPQPIDVNMPLSNNSSVISSVSLIPPLTSQLYSPHSPRSMLHERYSAELSRASFEEADGDDGVVIHNGLKRLSLYEVGYMRMGKPRIVNI